MKTKTAAEQRLPMLYRYSAFDVARLERILTTSTIYCANPLQFNDPWDCRPYFSKALLEDAAGRERVAKWFAQMGRKYSPHLPDAVHRQREAELIANRALLEKCVDDLTQGMEVSIGDQYRVLCLTTHPDNALMWAHYAGSHTGICLGFSVANPVICGAMPVTYAGSYPIYDPSDDDMDANLMALLTKSKDWAYEDEFRLIAAAPGYSFPGILPTVDNYIALPAGALKSVIFGCEMKGAERAAVRALVRGAREPLELLEAHRSVNRYALEIRPVR